LIFIKENYMEDIFNGAKKLGFGMMRLPKRGLGRDIKLTKKMVDEFMANGFTYFDTAWMYCAFRSESICKTVLTSRYPRESFTLATKLHAFFVHSKEDRDRIFKAQLRKTGAKYFDYYLLHDMGKDNYEKYEKLDCFNWIMEKKAKGLVKHIGFSIHDNAQVLDEILTNHPEMEFVQLQINYLDWDNMGVQSRLCYEVAKKHNKPVIVMEPVKGGTLAKIPPKAEEKFKALDSNKSIASYAIRFAASLDNVKMVLSGMSNEEQMLDNISFMKDFIPLDEKEADTVKEVVDIINSSIAIPCTACSYCVDGCPKHIPIPAYFSMYNVDKQEWIGGKHNQGYYDRLSFQTNKASACIKCRKCESVCPQHLEISELLKKVAKHFE